MNDSAKTAQSVIMEAYIEAQGFDPDEILDGHQRGDEDCQNVLKKAEKYAENKVKEIGPDNDDINKMFGAKGAIETPNKALMADGARKFRDTWIKPEDH